MAPRPVVAGSDPIWNAMQQVHAEVSGISPHDYLKLLAVIGGRSHGTYDPNTVSASISEYKSRWKWEQGAGASWTGTNVKYWEPHLNEIIKEATKHGKQAWVRGSIYTGPDNPGPTIIQQGADAVPNSIVNPLQEFSKLADNLISGKFWVRVGEGVLGVLLLAIGVDKALNLGVANKAVKKGAAFHGYA